MKKYWEKEYLEKKLDEGYSPKEIADESEVTIKTIYNWINKHKIDKEKPPYHKIDKEKPPYHKKDQLKKDLENSDTITEIAKKYDVSITTIDNWIDKHKIDKEKYFKEKYQDKEYLKEKLDAGYTQTEIADENEVTRKTVQYWIKKHDLTYNLKKDYQKRKFLYYLHRIKKMPVSEIADYFGCHYNTIYNWLKKHNIKVYYTRESLPEKKIRKFLEEQNIKYEKEYTFKNCKDKHVLRFDFAVFDNQGNLQYLIEYDGFQHFEPVEWLGGKEKFEKLKKRDKIKDEFCRENGIRLIRITNKDLGL